MTLCRKGNFVIFISFLPSLTVNGDKAVERQTTQRQTFAAATTFANVVKTTNAGDNVDTESVVGPDSLSSRRKTAITSTGSGSPEKRQAAVVQTSPISEHSPPKSQISPLVPSISLSTSPLSKSRNESILYEDDKYRVRYFPSSDMPEYPGGVPVFRRRSLHPVNDKEATSNPYEEFYIRSPRLQAKIDAERIISRVMSGNSTSRLHDTYHNVNYRENWFQKKKSASWFNVPSSHTLVNFFSEAFLGLCALLLAPFAAIRTASSRIRSAVGCKTLLALFFICILVVLMFFFIYYDPFYRNPVADLADRMMGPLASFSQPGN
ncbi:hypothetical protein Aperf_G00000031745 [Anoplocephala perfoliata]